MVIYLVDPVKQITKGKDSQRRQDFKQIRSALDTYYNDFNCYPTAIPFGQEWRVNNTVYMKKVPQDPNCGPNNSCYQYMYDQSATCPQWNVLFGRLVLDPSATTPACQLQSECLPVNYSSGYNLCDFGGDIDCDYLSSSTLDDSLVAPTPTSIESPPFTESPTPTSAPSNGLFFCACGSHHQTVCNVSYNIPNNVQSYLDPTCNNQCGLPC